MYNYERILSNIFKTDNMPNIILYGHYHINILSVLLNILKNEYTITEEVNIYDKGFIFKNTNIYYYFDMSQITLKNYSLFNDNLKNIINSNNFYTSQIFKFIIFDKFNNIKSNIQNMLRVIIEKYRLTSVFIIISNKYNNIINPIKSRCLSVRIPSLSNKDKRRIIHKNICYKNITEDYYDFLYYFNNTKTIHNLSKIKCIFDKGYITPCHKIINDIINIYEKKMNIENYTKLKDISYNILKYNLQITEFYQIFLLTLLGNVKIRNKTKYKLIHFIADSEYKYLHTYRSNIVLEFLLIYVYNVYQLSTRY